MKFKENKKMIKVNNTNKKKVSNKETIKRKIIPASNVIFRIINGVVKRKK